MDINNLVVRDGQWIEKAKQLYKIKQQIKELERVETFMQEELKIASEGMSAIGGQFLFEKTVKKGNIDYARIELLRMVDLEMYRKPQTEAWKLTIRLEE